MIWFIGRIGNFEYFESKLGPSIEICLFKFTEWTFTELRFTISPFLLNLKLLYFYYLKQIKKKEKEKK